MTICSIDNCNLDTYKENINCILHCKKDSYQSDRHKIGFLNSFYEELIKYIITEVENKRSLFDRVSLNNINLEKYLKQGSDAKTKESIFTEIVLTNIVFPFRDSRDDFDYLGILKKLNSIHFNYCEFNLNSLDLNSTYCFYQDCIFHNKWYIYNVPVLKNINNVLYQDCTFHDTVSSHSDDKYIIKSQLFNDCKFNNDIEFDNIIFKFPIFNNTKNISSTIKSFRITNCEIEEKFILNFCDIDLFLLESTVFKSKFEFKNNKVNEFKIFNTNYLKLVDMYETEYNKFSIVKSIFDDFVGFEKCVFGFDKNCNSDNSFVAKFTYATFLCFVNFRNTKFNCGLDIENINFKESPNFLNTEINAKYSNRETFRIIKDSFDKIGNNIEANKYFSYEMKKYKEELKNTNKKQERFIFFLNEKISNYGQSYVRPIFLMIISSAIYYLLVLGHKNNLLYKICTDFNGILTRVSGIFNGMSKSILPISRFLTDGMEFISLIFYIIFASLIWQTLIAIKRHTKR